MSFSTFPMIGGGMAPRRGSSLGGRENTPNRSKRACYTLTDPVRSCASLARACAPGEKERTERESTTL